jgi:hypothetical protein
MTLGNDPIVDGILDRLTVLESEVSKLKEKRHGKKFIPPSLEEVKAYCLKRKNSVDPEAWMNHYLSNGWKVGKAQAPMKDWHAAVRTWERPNGTNGNGAGDKHREELLTALKNSRNYCMPTLSAKAEELFRSQGKHWRSLQLEVQGGIVAF